uniref:DUF3098 domain-containing protein n=1 Tax=Alloprevotella sp. TaxID=1872471 RepID=UPI00402925A4
MAVVPGGRIVMSGAGPTESTVNTAIFDARHVKVAPAVALFGYLFIIYAIVRRPRDKQSTKEETTNENNFTEGNK